jgi:hypothetical protein
MADMMLPKMLMTVLPIKIANLQEGGSSKQALRQKWPRQLTNGPSAPDSKAGVDAKLDQPTGRK